MAESNHYTVMDIFIWH